MTTNKPLSAATVSSPPRRAQPQKAMLNQPTAHVSSLTQQLEQVSLDKSRQFSSPKRATSSASKRKSKADSGNTGSGNDIPHTTQHTAQQPKPKRSPKSNKVNGVKHPSTPSKPTSIPAQPQGQLPPNSVPNNNYAPAVQDLASHYAGPTFHSSPAPSSLPVPSFLASKAKPPTQNGDMESPPNQSTPVKSRAQYQDDSPLALFFKADREEKNRLRSKYSVDNGVFGSPTLRPASAGGIPDHMNLRSESPVFWNESPHKPNGRLDWKNHSTSELPFQMDTEYESMRHPRNHLVQRFRATTEPPNEYNPHTPTHFDPLSGKGAQSFARQEPAQHSDLETSTQTLKNLLSINSTPSGSSSSFTARNGPPSPSSIQHNRTRSLAQPPISKTSPSTSKVTPSRRVFSYSGVPPPNTFQSTLSRPIIPPEHEEAVIEEDDHTVKVEKELRKVLNLS